MSWNAYTVDMFIDSLSGDLWLWDILLQTWVFSGVVLDLDVIASLIDEN
uniref:Uncharacterized protein n=1 Tax=viral metagenome TaxID=1070528 RepID=A0A6C0JRZ5_9ZZZZ